MAATNNDAGIGTRTDPNCSHTSETYHGLPQSGSQMGQNMSSGVRQMGKMADQEDWVEGQPSRVTGRWDISRGRWISDNAKGESEPTVLGEGGTDGYGSNRETDKRQPQ